MFMQMVIEAMHIAVIGAIWAVILGNLRLVEHS